MKINANSVQVLYLPIASALFIIGAGVAHMMGWGFTLLFCSTLIAAALKPPTTMHFAAGTAIFAVSLLLVYYAVGEISVSYGFRESADAGREAFIFLLPVASFFFVIFLLRRMILSVFPEEKTEEKPEATAT